MELSLNYSFNKRGKRSVRRQKQQISMQKDYIMRIVEQFVQAILSIMRRRKDGQYKEAREQIRTAARYLLRIDIDLLLLFNNDYVLDHFKDSTNRLDTERCVLGADLF